MPLEDYTLPKENVKSRVEGESWTWCATSKRVVRHRSAGESEEGEREPTREVFQDVGYGEVSSIYRSRRRRSRVLDGFGVVLVLAGVAAFVSAGALYLGYASVDVAVELESVAAGFGVAAVALGLAAFVWNTVRRHSYVRLYGDTVLHHDDGGVWRLKTSEVDEEELAKFMKVMRSGSNKKRHG